jgi:hypothetical protein
MGRWQSSAFPFADVMLPTPPKSCSRFIAFLSPPFQLTSGNSDREDLGKSHPAVKLPRPSSLKWSSIFLTRIAAASFGDTVTSREIMVDLGNNRVETPWRSA